MFSNLGLNEPTESIWGSENARNMETPIELKFYSGLCNVSRHFAPNLYWVADLVNMWK